MSSSTESVSSRRRLIEQRLDAFGVPSSDRNIDTDDPDGPTWITSVHSMTVKWVHLTEDGIRYFTILRSYISPDSTMTLEATSQLLVNHLPKDKPHSNEVFKFGVYFLDLAEQIHFSQPSQLRLVGVLLHLRMSPIFGGIVELPQQLSYFYPQQRLKESMVDRIHSGYPEYEDPYEWVNITAFVAKLCDHDFFPGGCDWAMSELRRAHEEPPKYYAPHDAVVLAAAQWILWYGRKLFSCLVLGYSFGYSYCDEAACKASNLYTIQRWHVWRDGFRNFARAGHQKDLQDGNSVEESRVRGESLDGDTIIEDPAEIEHLREREAAKLKNSAELLKLAEECRVVSGKVANLMDAIEDTFTI